MKNIFLRKTKFAVLILLVFIFGIGYALDSYAQMGGIGNIGGINAGSWGGIYSGGFASDYGGFSIDISIPPVVSLEADPTSVDLGGSTTLTWTSSNVAMDYCLLSASMTYNESIQLGEYSAGSLCYSYVPYGGVGGVCYAKIEPNKTNSLTLTNLNPVGRHEYAILCSNGLVGFGGGGFAADMAYVDVDIDPIIPIFSCGGSVPSDGVSCYLDSNTGLTSASIWTEVSSCTLGAKCEYTVPTSSCGCGNYADHCRGTYWDDGCGNSCGPGTKDCGWREVAP